MRNLKMSVLAAGLAGAALVAGGPASATPVASGLAASAEALNAPLVEQAQYWGGYGGGYGYYGPPRRRYWGGYGGGWRPPVVCRIRYTPWGPRRVCFRRW